MSITVFTKNRCVQCTGTKRTLDKAGVDYATVNVEEDPVVLAKIKALGFASAPVILVDEGTPEEVAWSGNRPDLIKKHITTPLAQVAVA